MRTKRAAEGRSRANRGPAPKAHGLNQPLGPLRLGWSRLSVDPSGRGVGKSGDSLEAAPYGNLEPEGLTPNWPPAFRLISRESGFLNDSGGMLERETGVEPATPSLGSSCSTN